MLLYVRKKWWGKIKMLDNLVHKKNYDFVDFCKLVGSFVVLTDHTGLFYTYSNIADNLYASIISKLVVCFFFVASAFFFFNGIEFNNGKITKSQSNINKLKKYMIRTATLYLSWSAVYFFWSVYRGFSEGWISVGEIFVFAVNTVFNTSYYHLWFLLSLIYAIPLIYLFLRHFKLKVLLVVSAVIYILGVCYRSSGLLCMPFSELWEFSVKIFPRLNTVIFYVIPVCVYAIICDKLKIKRLYLVTIAVTLLYLIEGLFMHIYLSSFTLCMIPAVILIFTVSKNVNISIKHNYVIRKLSTIIYCIHPLVLELFNMFINKNNINSILYSSIILLLSTSISFILIILYKKVKPMNFLKYLM